MNYHTTTPTNAGGAVLLKARAVLYPTSDGVTLALSGLVDPDVTMFGLRRHPSRKMLFSFNALNVAAKTLSVTFWQTSMEWSPSARISGSTMGTSPFSWQIAAYLANPQAFSLMACSVGSPFPIFNTALHLANLHP